MENIWGGAVLLNSLADIKKSPILHHSIAKVGQGSLGVLRHEIDKQNVFLALIGDDLNCNNLTDF